MVSSGCDGGILLLFFFFFKQKTAYVVRISDWSSDVCSSDLARAGGVCPVAEHSRAAGRDDGTALAACPTQRLRRCELAGLAAGRIAAAGRSEARRVGTEGVSTCRSRWSPDH